MVLMGVAPPTYSLVSDDGDESRSAIDLKLGEVTIVGRKDIERSDSKLLQLKRFIVMCRFNINPFCSRFKDAW